MSTTTADAALLADTPPVPHTPSSEIDPSSASPSLQPVKHPAPTNNSVSQPVAMHTNGRSEDDTPDKQPNPRQSVAPDAQPDGKQQPEQTTNAQTNPTATTTTTQAETTAAANDADDDDDGEDLSLSDIRAAVDEIDENIDEAFENAAQSFWHFASSVTGTVSSAVNEAPSLETLRDNVTSHLKPLDAISHNISSKLEALAPTELPDRVATLAGSVKSVAQSVQRNAQQMELAILSKANGDDTQQQPSDDPDGAKSGSPVQAAEAGGGDSGGADDTTSGSSTSKGLDHQGQAKKILDDSAASAGLAVEEIAKVGASLGKTVGGLWSGLWGGEPEIVGWQRADGNGAQALSGNTAGKVPATRFEKKMLQLQADPNTYCEPAKDLDQFEKWGRTFNLDNETEECLEILSTHEEIAQLYERVVPVIVEEDTFWMRYFFAKYMLVQEEERRKKLLERAESGGAQGDAEDDWGDDDWGDADATAGDDDDDNNNDNGDDGDGDGDDKKQGDAAEKTGDNEGDSEAGEKKKKVEKKAETVQTETKAAVGNDGNAAESSDWGDDDWE